MKGLKHASVSFVWCNSDDEWGNIDENNTWTGLMGFVGMHCRYFKITN
jgi:hypothetical protein